MGCDIYSLGVTIYEVMMLNRAFEQSTYEQLKLDHQNANYPPLDKFYSPELTELVQRMMSVKHQDRPSYAEIIGGLDDHFAEEEVEKMPMPFISKFIDE
jgi:serine/threonine protein kinase